MGDSLELAFCPTCKKSNLPYMVGPDMYCTDCGRKVFSGPTFRKETQAPTSKRFRLYDKKGNFLCAFHDEQQAKERISTLAFNGVTAKMVDTGR
jgi:DNA-directed RNA polymerase subunit RPC12/RpoP